jgi:hypothetical protein
MNVTLITSLSINILLFILLMILLLVWITDVKPVSPSSQNQICPINYPDPIPPPFETNRKYILKTLSGHYVQSCFGCLPTPVSCANQGMIASEDWNGDTIELIDNQGMYNIKLNSKLTPTQTFYLTMVKVNGSNCLCLTQNQNQLNTMFQIISYISTYSGGSNLYQIGTPVSGTLIGESDPSCLVQQGLSLEDGYNISVNAPRGMEQKSFFLMLPA